MKITRHHQDHLSIQFNPGGLWLLGLVFILISVVAVVFLGNETTLVCTRSGEAVCTLSQKTMVKTTTRTIPLSQMRDAYVESNVDSDGDETFRVVLRTASGDIPLTSSRSSGFAAKRDAANQINAFLQSGSQPRLVVEQDDRLLLYIIGAILAGAGSLLILLTSRVALDLDRSTGLAVLSKNSLVTRSSEEYLLDDLAGAEVQESSGSDGRSYRVALVQHSGARIPLTSYYSSGHKGKQELADAINQFLHG